MISLYINQLLDPKIPKPHKVIHPEFIKKLKLITGYKFIPIKFQSLLLDGHIYHPYDMVNIFGGGQEALLKRFCFMEPAYWLYQYPQTTATIIIFSKTQRQLDLNSREYPLIKLDRSHKPPAYNDTFQKLTKQDLQIGVRTLKQDHFKIKLQTYMAQLRSQLMEWTYVDRDDHRDIMTTTSYSSLDNKHSLKHHKL